MSLLAEVISSVETIEIEDINKKVPEITLLAQNLKSELIAYTDNVYIKFSTQGRPTQNRELLKRAFQLQEEVKALQKIGENATKKNLAKSNQTLTDHIKSLTAIDFSLKVLSKISTIHEKLVEFSSQLQAKEFLECKIIRNTVINLINETPLDERTLPLEEIESKISLQDTHLLNKIRECYNEKIVIEKGENTSCLKIAVNKKPLDQALLAMFYNESNVYALSKLAKFLWDEFFVPIVDQLVTVEIILDNQAYNVLKININDSEKKSKFNIVFENIVKVVRFLEEHFNFPLNTVEPTLTTVECIGLDIRDNLSEIIIKHCLSDTIPSTVEGLKEYKIVIEETQKLETILKQSKIFAKDSTSLFEYANNIDIHFINKKCQQCYLQSEVLMKKDLHDMVEVGVPYDASNISGFDSNQFLQCCISKSVIELINLCQKLLQEAVKGTEVSAGRLFVTCQNILRNYTKLVPEYHKKLLKTIPQQVALFQNNCLYICYKTSEWASEYILKLSPSINLSRSGFTEEVIELRQIGTQMFSNYVKLQITQINEIMKDSGLDDVVLEGDLKPITEKSIRQCLRQQELLKTVWHKVLSYPVYNKTLGAILNSLCVWLINRVIQFEDISSNSAEQLVDIIKIIVSRGPKLFTDPKEIPLYVEQWYKLNELSFVLGASLIEINDRWADGKGPLALQFKPFELKALIRALFQNTDRRAAVLAKIQD